MVPTTRHASRATAIVVHDSDSDPEIFNDDNTELEEHQPIKKRKTASESNRVMDAVVLGGQDGEVGDAMDVDPPEQSNGVGQTINKNAHLKGRKRFNADLADMKDACKGIFQVDGLRVKNLRPGDDEGSFEFKILTQELDHIVAVNLLVSDTSEYPGHHSYFAFSSDSDTPQHVLEAIESVTSGKSRDIRDAVEKLLCTLARTLNAGRHVQGQDIDDEGDGDGEGEDGDGENYDAYDELEDFGPSAAGIQNLDLLVLQRDFVEIVATGYRPGLIRFGIDDFALSISIPVITLAASIPPRALMAWDRRLLSRTQHLTLLINGWRGTYPILQPDGTSSYNAVRNGAALQFKVGLTRGYKPGKEHAAEAGRTFGLITDEVEYNPVQQPPPPDEFDDAFLFDRIPGNLKGKGKEEEEEEEDKGLFEKFSMSSSLESLLDNALIKVIQLRKKFGLGWAGAETLLAEVEKSQRTPEDIYGSKRKAMKAADKEEAQLALTYDLPYDPLSGQDKTAEVNLPLIAFCYLVRRLTLCTRYCPVCHNKVKLEYETLKPYVCDSKLCSYQYYSLNRGPSLEYEIRHNPETVDLLVSLTYSAAAEKVLDEPLPVGMGLRVPLPDPSTTVPVVQHGFSFPSLIPGIASVPTVPPAAPAPPPLTSSDPDGLCDFDDFDIWQMRACIAQLISSLPPIHDMKKHLEKKVRAGKSKPKLKDMDPSILPAAWSILRWCVASCTAHLEELSNEEDRVRNIDPSWRQFRFSVGAPDAEAKFKTALTDAQAKNANAMLYPSLYAFHGSPLKNWHSIIRHGLWYKTITHGRAYGNGVYLAKDGAVSMGHYASSSRLFWRNSSVAPVSCVALAEIVNLPSQFVSSNPYFVVGNTHWIMCRYLLVKSAPENCPEDDTQTPRTVTHSKVPLVKLDPAHPLTLSGSGNATRIEIPTPSYRLEKMVMDRTAEYVEEDMDTDDQAVFEAKPPQSQPEVIEIEDTPPPGVNGPTPLRAANDWKHNADWVNACVAHLLPPPVEATPSATMALQRELRSMLKEQDSAKSLQELGWYMPPELISDNLFQWIVEMHSFDDALPIAKDLKGAGLNSLVFEIRFPPSFPLGPPFFRIIKPRFLPFIQGGGGHVTGGGSMCMDLLTSDGWLPSYSISAILLQIKLAISNLDPRPARLARNWDSPYAVGEALEGYKRAARAHGWKIPQGIEKLVR